MANKITLYAGRNADGEIVFFGTKPYTGALILVTKDRFSMAMRILGIFSGI